MDLVLQNVLHSPGIIPGRRNVNLSNEGSHGTAFFFFFLITGPHGSARRLRLGQGSVLRGPSHGAMLPGVTRASCFSDSVGVRCSPQSIQTLFRQTGNI